MTPIAKFFKGIRILSLRVNEELHELNKMTDQGNNYNHLDQENFGFQSESQKATKVFVGGLNRFYLKIAEDFFLFCEFSCLDPTDLSTLAQFYRFKQLAKIINEFPLQLLTKMIELGWKLPGDW